jgi:hypothetical protein
MPRLLKFPLSRKPFLPVLIPKSLGPLPNPRTNRSLTPILKLLLSTVAPFGIVIETDRPGFRWAPLNEASFQVSVYDENYVEIVRSDWLDSSHWQAPRPLKRRKRYLWQLKVRRAGSEFTVPAPPAPEARFGVLSAEAAEELARLRAHWGDSHLLLGVAYGQVGLLEDVQISDHVSQVDVTDTVSQVLGRPARNFEQWACENRQAFA